MNDDKVRIRSKEELESREKCFLEIVDVFEKNNIDFFIQAGVVLGARRDNYFIKWDWDVEFGIFEENFKKNHDLIKEELLKKNFKIYHEIKGLKDNKIDVIKDFGPKSTVYEILSWRYSWIKKKYHRWYINIPSKFFREKHTINFLGKEIHCPGPVDEYLSYQYGDWQTPNQTSVKEGYLSKEFYNNPSNNLFHKIKKKLSKKLKKI